MLKMMLLSQCWKKCKERLALSREQLKIYPTMTSLQCQQGIAQAIQNKKPYLVARMGWLEACLIGQSITQGEVSQPLRERLELHAGVYPPTAEEFQNFASTYLKAIKQVDVLGLMNGPYEGWLAKSYASQARRVILSDLEPYFHEQPWSENLEGKSVLVVHPFEKSIVRQYQLARKKLFKNPKVLPLFELQVIKAPQTIAGTFKEFDSWTKTLNALEQKVEDMNFDVAILGCGAYGLPLGATIKKMGKIAIHLGGATQLLFGVSGGRWRNNPKFQYFINEHWIEPSVEERPRNYQKIEGGAYW